MIEYKLTVEKNKDRNFTIWKIDKREGLCSPIIIQFSNSDKEGV